MKRLIVITLPDFFPEEADRINWPFHSGLERLHLRKPHAGRASLKELLGKIDSEFYPRMVLHDCFDLAEEFVLGGIHLNRRNPEPLPSFKGTVSRSCHSISELGKYPDLDYLFLSPIFPSISKSGYGDGFPIGRLRDAAEKGEINDRIYALGGISAETIPLLDGLPFGGVAVLGALWGSVPCKEVKDNWKDLHDILSEKG